MNETIDRSAVKDIRVGTWEGDNERPAIFFAYTATGAMFVDTPEWLDAGGNLIDWSDSHFCSPISKMNCKLRMSR